MLESANTRPDVDGRATRWDAHKTRRRRQLLDAAVTAIETLGPTVGVKQIAEQAGVPRSVLYRHFADRADLDEQISQRIVDLLQSQLAPTLRPRGTATEAIRRVVGTYLDWIEQHPHLYTFLGAHGRTPAGGSRVVAGTKAALAAQVAELFATATRTAGRDASFAPTVASGLVGFVDATVNHWLADKRRMISTEELAEYLTRSIWSVLDGNARALGIQIDPDRPISDLLDD
ncbi:TetR/AcrR family transcriptional regulator [Haloechinothrix salitolerans]|uniref:TetR/AcrR family transcriptional regulator n=1 Tax=Haloechinothrix salitolerans TaxID=926830 RepID=A0ABW2C181_9PSEU